MAKAINYSPSMVSAVELGQAPPTSKYLEQFDKLLDTGGLYTRMLTDLVVLDKNQAWSRGWRRIQAESWALRWFDPLHVPGLLQTEAYARAVFESDPLLEPEEVERRLADRLDGQAVLYAEHPSRLVGVMDEAVLRRRVGGRKVMCDQLSHLTRLAVEHPHVRVQVVPCSAEEYPGLNGPFILASMAGGGKLAFLGGQTGGQEFDRPAVPRACSGPGKLLSPWPCPGRSPSSGSRNWWSHGNSRCAVAQEQSQWFQRPVC